MSELVSRKALLKFLYANYEENKLSQSGKALDYVIKKIEADAFPSTESEGEIESLRKEIANQKEFHEGYSEESIRIESQLRDQIESLKAITEIAVKELNNAFSAALTNKNYTTANVIEGIINTIARTY